VYSLGAILYALLTGRPPFKGSSDEILRQVLMVDPAPPTSLRPGLDRRFDAVCGRARAKQIRAGSADPSKLALLERDFSFEPYALVLPRDDPDFRLAVNRAMVEIYRSGDIDDIFYRWLGALARPGPLLPRYSTSTPPE
jgi:serine/threonine protein kinase